MGNIVKSRQLWLIEIINYAGGQAWHSYVEEQDQVSATRAAMLILLKEQEEALKASLMSRGNLRRKYLIQLAKYEEYIRLMRQQLRALLE